MSRRRSSRDFQEARRLARRAHRRQGGKCFWCHEPMLLVAHWEGEQHPRLMTADHVHPCRWGGRTNPDNIVAACYECNHTRDRELPRSQLRGLEELRSPFEVLQALKPVLEAERIADEREQELRREMRVLARYGQLP